MSCAIALRPLLAGVARGSRAASVASLASHAPHPSGLIAGPSRCFCTSARHSKASELPLDYTFHDMQQESFPSSNHDSPSLWPAPSHRHNQSSTLYPITDVEDPPIYRNQPFPQPKLPPISPSRPPTTRDDDFFTSAAPSYHPTSNSKSKRNYQYAPLYIDTLDEVIKTTFLDSVRILIQSGERSMQSLVSSIPGSELSEEQSEQLACLVLLDCVKQQQDAHSVWELYNSWLRTTGSVCIASPGPTRAPMCNLQAKALYKTCVYLQSAGLIRQAAVLAADQRLKPSQARFLVRNLAFDRQLSGTLKSRFNTSFLNTSTDVGIVELRIASSEWFKTCIVLQELANTMCTLMVRGTTIESGTLTRVLKAVCLTASHSHAVRLFCSAQRRAQLDLAASSSKASHTTESFWQRRPDEPAAPAVLDTAALETLVRLLCSQKKAGAQAAYKMVKCVSMEQRSKAMYDSLMKVYGHAPLVNAPASADQPRLGRSSLVGHQILQDLTMVPHLGGVSVDTVSSRILSHAGARRWDAIRSDLAFLRTSELKATIHDVQPQAQLAIVRCGVETGHLQIAFGIAARLLTRSQATTGGKAVEPASVVHTLLLSGQVMRAETPRLRASPDENGPRVLGLGRRTSRTRLLMRFLTHYAHLHLKFPGLEPTLETLTLFVRLLAMHERSIYTPTLSKMVHVISSRFAPHDTRVIPLLLAFARVFQDRHDVSACAQIQSLIQDITTAAHKHNE